MTPEQKQEKRIYVAIDRALSHVPGITSKDICNAVGTAVRAFKQGEQFEHIFGADRPKKQKTAKKKNPQDSTMRNVRAGSKKVDLLMRLYAKLNRKVLGLEKVIYGSKVNTKKT